MWEYRIFSEGDFYDKVSQLIDIENIEVEERTDFYYDLHHKEYGLKERLGCEPKLELKIRLDRTPNGIEYWEKVISHPYPDHYNSHLPMYQIDDILSNEAEENQEFSSDIELLLQQIPNDYEITKVSKRRWEREMRSEIEIEYGIVNIKGGKLYSFSLESQDLMILEELITKLDLSEAKLCGGYPSLVGTINDIPKLLAN